jgi:lipopolysaccharide transport system ATP-binding protein
MLDIAISVENLSKSYLVGHNAAQSESYKALRDVLTLSAQNLARKTRDMVSGRTIVQGDEVEEFWALKDVSFEIKRGDRVGIIGRNGAGKSTLLKILSRITEPTTGRIKIAGRVVSLLEVGTGFHPELTGRENIFLNGAILGMSRWEIQLKFDEIVDFSGVEKFLDTPVKRYSSGMYVRLAFAVAAHLEPEILIVDEVLAVGDAQFQKKCLGKMQEIGNNGRTVLLVSHNMAAISNLCKNVIYMDGGKLHTVGNTATVVNAYLRGVQEDASVQLSERKDRKGSGIARFHSVDVINFENRKTTTIMCGHNIIIRIKLSSQTKNLILRNPIIAIGIDNSVGQRVLHLCNETIGKNFDEINIENHHLDIKIQRFPLVAGIYTAAIYLSSDGSTIDWIQNAFNFNVEQGDFYQTGKLPPQDQGFFMADYSIGVGSSHALS